MQLFSRGGVFYVRFRYWDEQKHKRVGKRISTGVIDDGTARARRVAEQNGAQVVQSFASGSVRRAKPLTLKRCIEIHTEAHELASSSQATIDIVIRCAQNLYDFFLPTYDCNGFTNKSLMDYAARRFTMPGARRGENVQPGTVHREIRTLREGLADAAKAGKYTGPIPDEPDIGVIYRPRERVLLEGETKAALLAIPVARRDYFVMWRQHGIDRDELYNIEPGDIDWAKNEVRIRGTKTEDRDRVLPLLPETRHILEQRAKMVPMFPRWHNALRDMKLAAKRAGIEPFCIKDLRRSFATEMAIADVNPLWLKDLMGHADTRMLEKIYAKVKKGKHMHAAMGKMGELRPVPPKREEDKGIS